LPGPNNWIDGVIGDGVLQGDDDGDVTEETGDEVGNLLCIDSLGLSGVLRLARPRECSLELYRVMLLYLFLAESPVRPGK